MAALMDAINRRQKARQGFAEPLYNSNKGPDLSGLPSQIRNRWWEVPNLTFQEGSTPGSVRLGFSNLSPSGASTLGIGDLEVSVPEQYATREFRENPQAFYDFVQALPEDQRPFALANLASTASAQNAREQARQDAISALREGFGLTQQGQESFQTDPVRQMIEQRLTALSSPEATVISPQEEQAARNIIAQQLARENAARTGSAASRGVLASGPVLQNTAAARGIAAGQAAQLRARVLAANEQGRRQALTDLARFQGDANRLELAYQNELNRIDAAIAQIQASEEFQPSDFMAYQVAAFGQQQYQDQQALYERALSDLEQESAFGPEDALRYALEFVGTGAYRPILGAAESIFGG